MKKLKKIMKHNMTPRRNCYKIYKLCSSKKMTLWGDLWIRILYGIHFEKLIMEWTCLLEMTKLGMIIKFLYGYYGIITFMKLQDKIILLRMKWHVELYSFITRGRMRINFLHSFSSLQRIIIRRYYDILSFILCQIKLSTCCVTLCFPFYGGFHPQGYWGEVATHWTKILDVCRVECKNVLLPSFV